MPNMSLDERLYVMKFARLGNWSPCQFAIAVRVFENDEVISHPNNNRLSVWTSCKLSEDGKTTTLVGYTEKGIEKIWNGPTEERPDVPLTQKKAYDWIRQQMERMSSKYGLPLEYSFSFKKNLQKNNQS